MQQSALSFGLMAAVVVAATAITVGSPTPTAVENPSTTQPVSEQPPVGPRIPPAAPNSPVAPAESPAVPVAPGSPSELPHNPARVPASKNPAAPPAKSSPPVVVPPVDNPPPPGPTEQPPAPDGSCPLGLVLNPVLGICVVL